MCLCVITSIGLVCGGAKGANGVPRLGSRPGTPKMPQGKAYLMLRTLCRTRVLLPRWVPKHANLLFFGLGIPLKDLLV